jgi:hypothetical protein
VSRWLETKWPSDISSYIAGCVWRSLSLQPPAHAGSSPVDFFNPEDGGDTLLRNVG